jgi:hypothetical protein
MSYEPVFWDGDLHYVRTDDQSLPPDNQEFQDHITSTTGLTFEQWLEQNTPAWDVTGERQRKIVEAKRIIEARLGLHYSPYDLLTLTTMLSEAYLAGKTNRVDYLLPLKSWAENELYGLFYTVRNEINQATRMSQMVAIIDGLTARLITVEQTKPQVTFEAAKEIDN